MDDKTQKLVSAAIIAIDRYNQAKRSLHNAVVALNRAEQEFRDMDADLNKALDPLRDSKVRSDVLLRLMQRMTF